MIRLSKCRQVTVGFVIAALALAVGVYVVQQKYRAQPPVATIDAATIELLWTKRLPDTDGNATTIGEWRGKTLVLNFWASWCQPCREEMPAFSRLHLKYTPRGAQFVGIAVDSPQNAADFLRKLPISYPSLVAESEGGEMMRQLGNPRLGLPYTLIITPDGKAALMQMGKLTEQQLDDHLQQITSPR